LKAAASTLPYAALSPAQVLAQLQAVGLDGDGRLLQLNSYENRVFQVMLEDGTAVVAKFYRPARWSVEQVLEEHAFAAEAAQAEVPVVAPLRLHAADAGTQVFGEPPSLAQARVPASAQAAERGEDSPRYAVWPRRSGRAPEVDSLDVLERLGGFIGRLHAVGARRPFMHRRSLHALADAQGACDQLEVLGAVPAGQAARWKAVAQATAQAIGEAFDRQGQVQAIRLHGDCHLGNLLWREEGVHVVDLDDACNGPAVQDLWMLLHGDAQAQERQRDALLRGYERFAEFDDAQWQLVEALRSLRLLRHNAWIAQRWSDPAFPAAFAGFGSEAWWTEQCAVLHEQLEVMSQV
jgi:Ser/Thr protein kinase RdoA (MazF antagonist)